MFIASASIAAVMLCAAPQQLESHGQEQLASSTQVGEAPVAAIGYLPDSVSNITKTWTLNATASYDPDGNITSYLWTVEHENSTIGLTGAEVSYAFEDPGLYKITLTVTDEDDNIGTAFTAVYSFSDADDDGLPDWWEDKYIDTLKFDAEDDLDQDGFSNLEEYARNSNPLVADSSEAFHDAYWRELVAIAAAAIVVLALIYRRQRRKHKEEERRKIEYAIEIQKALDEE